jgi:hypothetical protein
MLHVAARNQRYKVVCANDAAPGSCEFYDLEQDPLEEYPLPRPASCAAYANGALRDTSAEWSYCHLHQVLEKESILSQPRPAPARGRGGAAPPAN